MAKKFQLTELKVTSFVTTLSEHQQETAKGGSVFQRLRPSPKFSIRPYWTEAKTEHFGFGVSAYNGKSKQR